MCVWTDKSVMNEMVNRINLKQDLKFEAVTLREAEQSAQMPACKSAPFLVCSTVQRCERITTHSCKKLRQIADDGAAVFGRSEILKLSLYRIV